MIFFQSKAVEQRLQKIPPIEGPRGAIYDRNGIPLAISVSSNTVYAIPVEVEDVAATAQQLASILGLEEQYLRERLSKRSSVEWLQKKISDAQARKIIALDLPGVGGCTHLQPHLPLWLHRAAGSWFCGHRQSGLGGFGTLL